jgi:phenylacetate-coenzyme A ligase PaaK-like adenylate-forming protein
VDLLTVARLLTRRRALARRDGWTVDELKTYQARKLAELRRFAVEQSPFYAELHRGLEGAPLAQLPIVTKQMVMANFDRLVTDRAVRLADVEEYVARATADAKFHGRYRVALTGGTTGRRGVFLADDDEWATVLASYARANDWAGVRAGPLRRLRLAVVSSSNPTHQSVLVGASLASPIVPTLRIDAGDAIGSIVERVNAFGPQLLVGYASILAELAAEQSAGRLHVRPEAIMSASEVLSPSMRLDIERAFGSRVYDVYAATETAGIASECQLRHIHLYEDLVLVENVDQDGHPVEVGTRGDRLLVTVLFNRTQPLIRYELSDSVTLSTKRCADGRPFALLESVSGRTEDTLTIEGVRIYPNVFHAALDELDTAGWQVVERDRGVDVLVIADPPAPDRAVIQARLRRELERVGAQGVAVNVQFVDDLPRTALGKQPLIRRRAA